MKFAFILKTFNFKITVIQKAQFKSLNITSCHLDGMGRRGGKMGAPNLFGAPFLLKKAVISTAFLISISIYLVKYFKYLPSVDNITCVLESIVFLYVSKDF